MDDPRSLGAGEKVISHPPIHLHGRDIYPPDMYAAALANSVPGEFAERWVSHEPIVLNGKDVYPAEMFMAAYRADPGRCSTSELLELVRAEARSLTQDEFRALHDIAFQRLTDGDPAARELVQTVFRSVLSRVA